MYQSTRGQILSPWQGDKVDSDMGLKVHKIEIFLASILKFVLFLYYLCQNIKILQKTFFNQAIIRGDTIFPLSLRLTSLA